MFDVAFYWEACQGALGVPSTGNIVCAARNICHLVTHGTHVKELLEPTLFLSVYLRLIVLG